MKPHRDNGHKPVGYKLVVLESPYAAPDEAGIAANLSYARACVMDCLARGESPIASHLLFTQPGILRDAQPEERALGIGAGHAWLRAAEASVVYIDRGYSDGMRVGITRAIEESVPVLFRRLGGIWETGR